MIYIVCIVIQMQVFVINVRMDMEWIALLDVLLALIFIAKHVVAMLAYAQYAK
jgi:hypothetical protein